VEDVDDKNCMAAIDFKYRGEQYHIEAEGNGPIDAVKLAINQKFDRDICVLNYSEHALGSGSHARAASYIQMRDNRTGKVIFGAGDSSNITKATIRAFFSGLNRLSE
jgi:2-isopropylmalate synthase